MMRRASELLHRQPLSTGIEELDGLIGGLRPGALHVFYGDSSITDRVLYRLMVEASRSGPVAYLNNTDYYGEKTLIDANAFSSAAKAAGVDPLVPLASIKCAAAFNARRQVCAAERLAEAVRSGEEGARLIAVHNASAFLAEGGEEASQALVRSVAVLMEAASEVGAALVVTAAARGGALDFARPLLPFHVVHRASVLVFFRLQGLEACCEACQALLSSGSAGRCSQLPLLVAGHG